MLEPSDASLDMIPASVRLAIEWLRRLVRAGRNDSLDAPPTQPCPNPRIAVALVSRHPVRSSATGDRHGVHEPFEEDRFMTLAGRDHRSKRDACTIRYKMKLRAKASAGSSQGEVVRLLSTLFFEDSAPPAADTWARMEDPSTSKTLQSIRPSASSDT